ncbi:MAG: TetR/AcrR family transcriptional regulator [Lachnospiraceae bacterium]|jgi:AcrR family transcriptional regulator|nr:TetR/AcrR family transcriptional regulator [Lachnospiraceae bacterium]
MEDKRVIKTKRNIKHTMIAELGKTGFNKITVTDICKHGQISRITFYTYYNDKYDLIEEMFRDYVKEADDDYHVLIKNVDLTDRFSRYEILLECILNLYYNNIEFFSHAVADENPYLFSEFYRHIFMKVQDYIERHNELKPKYSSRQTAALLCNGVWTFITESRAMGLPDKTVRRDARNCYKVLLESDLFTK